MTSLTISANNSAFLEQILEIAKIIAKKQGSKNDKPDTKRK